MTFPYYQDDDCVIYHGDCLEIMPELESVDLVLCDLPYGTTACSWDTIIPFESLWIQYKRLIKDNRAIILFGSEPFSTYLRISNIKQYKYDWIWNKGQGLNFVTAKYRPLNDWENIMVFSNGIMRYFPIMENAKFENRRPINRGSKGSDIHGSIRQAKSAEKYDESKRFPKATININSRIDECNSLNRLHPMQKPISLLSYLIRTYTNESDIILDNAMGSGTTLVAAKQLNRKAIGIEIEEKYCEIAAKRIEREERLKRKSFKLLDQEELVKRKRKGLEL